MSRLALLALLAITVWHSSPVKAASPPQLPLPACVDGQGACPKLNPLVTGTAAGTLSAGGSIILATMPTGPVCGSMDGYTYIWSPNACYAGVHKPVIVSCAYIDLKDMKFKELNCQSALYRVASQAPAPLFTLIRPAGNTDYGGSTACGADADYETFAWGGPYTIKESIWMNRGDRARFCELTMGAKRPDGLYGPTWAKVRVGISYGEDGIGRSGRAETAEFYVPIDGDLREGVDVDMLVTHQLAGSGDNRTLKFSLVVENKGAQAADSVTISHLFPDALHVLRTSDSSCTVTNNFTGGNVVCNFPLPGKDDPLGRNVKFIDIETRIINASDLGPRFTFRATAANDVDTTNNEDSVNPVLNLRSATVEETLLLLKGLDPYFNYKTAAALLDKQCDVYMNDIYARLNSIKDLHPEVFTSLSFGRVTSGIYQVPVIRTDAGHVGVVVYPTGTDYHQTGVIIHGTPTWSPTDQDDQTIMGTQPMGEHETINVFREGTADHGMYYRTPLKNFPGSPKPENPLGCGFEGAYGDNSSQFARTPPAMCGVKSNQEADIASNAQSCPFYPDAVMVRTESPVDLLITNARGQRVQTTGGAITQQELQGGIFSYPVPHQDGTFGWVVVLPKDQYDIKLTGNGAGPYKLTLRQFDTNGDRVDKVTEGVTAPGHVDSFAFDAATTPVAPPTSGGGGNDNGTGGGGAADWLLLLALAGLLLVAARRRPLASR